MSKVIIDYNIFANDGRVSLFNFIKKQNEERIFNPPASDFSQNIFQAKLLLSSVQNFQPPNFFPSFVRLSLLSFQIIVILMCVQKLHFFQRSFHKDTATQYYLYSCQSLHCVFIAESYGLLEIFNSLRNIFLPQCSK